MEKLHNEGGRTVNCKKIQWEEDREDFGTGFSLERQLQHRYLWSWAINLRTEK